MNIDLNYNSKSSHEMFFIGEKRAKEILRAMADVCCRKEEDFMDRYSKAAQGDVVHLDAIIAMRDMVDIAMSEHEKNYIIFFAKDFIDKTTDRLKYAIQAIEEENG